MADATITKKSSGRNYEIDFLKLIFAVFVFINHTTVFIKENTRINPLFCSYLGWIGVWFFFVVSGFLMVESLSKKDLTADTAGKSSLKFVVSKFGGIAVPYLIAEYLFVVIYRMIILKENVFLVILKTIPVDLAITSSGITIRYNGPIWYISAMLIAMLPLCYLLIKKRDFFLYVFSPLCSVMILGFMYMQDNPLIDINTRFGFISGAILRAVAGLCSGVVAWLIYKKITDDEKHLIYTAIEFIGWITFIISTFLQLKRDNQLLFVTMIYMPALIAVSFSGKSLISKLFAFSWMKYFGKLSLLIYLNHFLAQQITFKWFSQYSYKICVLIMLGFTVLLASIAWGLEFAVKGLAKRCKNIFEKR